MGTNQHNRRGGIGGFPIRHPPPGAPPPRLLCLPVITTPNPNPHRARPPAAPIRLPHRRPPGSPRLSARLSRPVPRRWRPCGRPWRRVPTALRMPTRSTRPWRPPPRRPPPSTRPWRAVTTRLMTSCWPPPVRRRQTSRARPSPPPRLRTSPPPSVLGSTRPWLCRHRRHGPRRSHLHCRPVRLPRRPVPSPSRLRLLNRHRHRRFRLPRRRPPMRRRLGAQGRSPRCRSQR